MLLFYDIKPELDKHGARVRLVRLLRRKGGIPLQRSTWLLHKVDGELLRMLEEVREKGGVVFLSEWKPIPLSSLRGDGGPRRVGVVIQGPEPLYGGMAGRLLGLLEEWGVRREVRVSGTLGRVAALDLGWREGFETPLLPSQALEELSRGNPDLLILLTGCKSQETGVYMGKRIAENARLVRLLGIPLTQVETAEGGAVIHWSGDPSLSQKLARGLSLELRFPPPFTGKIERRGGRIYRTLVGVRPGEKILVDGYVVGESLSTHVTLVARGGRLEGILGGRKYPRGIRKVGRVDLARCTVKTLRTLREISPGRTLPGRRRGNWTILVERADTVLERAGRARLAIAVGDDTTLITHAILSRLGVPVLGVVDGDADGLLEGSGRRGRGLSLIRVKPGKDDEAGKLLRERLFGGKDWMRIRTRDPEEIKRRAVRILGELVEEVVTP